jgi:hypothetical protein
MDDAVDIHLDDPGGKRSGTEESEESGYGGCRERAQLVFRIQLIGKRPAMRGIPVL